MTQEDINITQTFIKYDQNVLMDKLNQQMDTLMGLQYKFSNNTKKDYHKKYLLAVLQNVQTICDCFFKHNLINNEEIEKINDHIKTLRPLLKTNETNISGMSTDDLICIYISDLIDVIFLLDIYEDEIEEEEDVEEDDDDADFDNAKIEEELNNKTISDHASIINIENEFKKRKCDEH